MDEPLMEQRVDEGMALRHAAQVLYLAEMEPNPDMVRAKVDLATGWLMLADTLSDREG